MDEQNRNRNRAFVPQPPSHSSSSSVFSEADKRTHLLMGHAPGTIIPNRIFVGGLDYKVTENLLRRIFSPYGTVTEVKIITNHMGMSKGYGFVTFGSRGDVVNILSKANRICYRDKKLCIGQAFKKYQAPGPASFVSVHKPFVHPDPYRETFYLTTPTGIPYTFHKGVAYFNCPTVNQAACQWSHPQNLPQHLQWNALQVQAPPFPALYAQQTEFLYQQADGAPYLPFLPVMEDSAAQFVEPTVPVVYQGSSALVLQPDPVKTGRKPHPLPTLCFPGSYL